MGWITFAAAGGLIAIPILIHLFNRTRYRKVQWAAMEFLLAAYKKTRKRMQFEHLLLLLLRILAMACLAFAFFPAGVSAAAQWALNSMGVSLAEGTQTGRPRHLVLVVDDSASMQFERLNTTNFERAMQLARGLVSELQEGRDRVTVVLASRVGNVEKLEDSSDDDAARQAEYERLNRVIAARDVRATGEALASASPTNGSAEMLAVLREAGRRISSMDVEREIPSLAIVSDFQNSQWTFTREGDAQHQAYLELMTSIDGILEEHEGSLSFHDINAKDMANYAITDLQLELGVISPGIRPAVRVTVGNYGNEVGLPARVRLQYRIDGGEASPILVPSEVEPGTQYTLSQELPPFQKTGTHSITFEITNEDSFEADNARTLAVNVTESIPIMIIDGYALNPKDASGQDRTGVMPLDVALSLASGGEGDVSRVTPLDVVVADATNLSTISLEKKRVVIIANLPTFDEAFAEKLETYVSAGNSVLFALGPDVNVEQYNKLLWNEGRGLLPVKLGAMRSAAPGEFYGMIGANLDPGSPLELFGAQESTRAILEAPKGIQRWMELLTPQQLKLARAGVRPSNVLLRVNTTDATDDSTALEEAAESDEEDASEALPNPPVLVLREFGRGRALVWGTSIDDEWGSMWTPEGIGSGMPVYLFNELVRKIAAGDLASRNLTIGQPWVRVLDVDEQRAAGYEIAMPGDGATVKPLNTAMGDQRRKLSFENTVDPGVYEMRALVRGESGDISADYVEHFAVNLPAQESNVQRLAAEIPLDGITAGAPQEVISRPLQNAGIEASFETQTSEANATVGTRSEARREDVWLLFLGLAALCLLLETGVSVWFGSKPE